MSATAKNTMGGETPRIVADAYYTPDALALAIARRVREAFGIFDLVIEPSAGAGAFVRAARAAWPDAGIRAVEPNSEATGGRPDNLMRAGASNVSLEGWESCEAGCLIHDGPRPYRTLIIGNPPYNLPGDGRGNTPTTAEKHVKIALDRMRDGDALVFLLRLAFLSGGGRIERLHAVYPLAALWPVTPRPSFTGGGTDGGEYGAFVWIKGHTGGCDLRPLVWVADAKRRTA